jgi:hypothetical protein
MDNMEEGKLKSEKIWIIWKNPSWNVKRYGNYGRKVSWIVKRYGKYGRKVGWIVKWYGKYGGKLWNDMENMEERQVE